MWSVYGLICKDKSLYIGSANNLKRRIEEHRAGKSLGIKYRAPYRLEFYIVVKNETIARSLEKYLKSGSGRAIIKKRILSAEAR